MSLRIRRGLSTDIPAPLEGELLYTTDNGNLYVGFYDQAQDAVIPKLTSASLIDDSNPTLSANLDLGGNNIVGTGSINIDGTITATGNINLGDGAEDNVIVGGAIGSSLIPESDGVYDLGSVSLSWREGFFKGISVNGSITAESISVNKIYANDSSLLYNNETDTFTANFEGDLIGSVFSADSAQLVDAINSKLTLESMSLVGNRIETDGDEGVEILSSDPGGRGYLKIFSNKADYALRIDGITNGDIAQATGHFYNVSRGTLENPTIVQPNDFIHVDVFTAYDGTETIPSTAFFSVADPNKTTSSGSMPGKLFLATFTEDDVLTSKAISLDSDGNVSIGYTYPVDYVAKDTLDVNGGAIFSQSIAAPTLVGSVTSDDSTVIIDSSTNQITGTLNELDVIGTIENPSNNSDSLTPTEWLKLTVNGEARYLPLYS